MSTIIWTFVTSLFAILCGMASNRSRETLGSNLLAQLVLLSLFLFGSAQAFLHGSGTITEVVLVGLMLGSAATPWNIGLYFTLTGLYAFRKQNVIGLQIRDIFRQSDIALTQGHPELAMALLEDALEDFANVKPILKRLVDLCERQAYWSEAAHFLRTHILLTNSSGERFKLQMQMIDLQINRLENVNEAKELLQDIIHKQDGNIFASRAKKKLAALSAEERTE